MASYNIKQFTNYSDMTKIPTENGYYRLEKVGDIVKLGYTCENKGLNIPIYITFNESITDKESAEGVNEIIPPKSGLYEFQIENYLEGEAVPLVKKVWLPVGIKFTLDYVTRN